MCLCFKSNLFFLIPNVTTSCLSQCCRQAINYLKTCIELGGVVWMWKLWYPTQPWLNWVILHSWSKFGRGVIWLENFSVQHDRAATLSLEALFRLWLWEMILNKLVLVLTSHDSNFKNNSHFKGIAWTKLTYNSVDEALHIEEEMATRFGSIKLNIAIL